MKKLMFLAMFLFVSFRCLAPTYGTVLCIERCEPLHPFGITDPVLMAVGYNESRFIPDIINVAEDAGGFLQIRHTMITEVNRICVEIGLPDRFVLADRLSPDRSIRIWCIIMAYHNPDNDLRTACLVWNGRGKDGKGSLKYYNNIRKYLETQI